MYPLFFLWAHRQRIACPARVLLTVHWRSAATHPSPHAGQLRVRPSLQWPLSLEVYHGALNQGGRLVVGLCFPGRTCDTSGQTLNSLGTISQGKPLDSGREPDPRSHILRQTRAWWLGSPTPLRQSQNLRVSQCLCHCMGIYMSLNCT